MGRNRVSGFDERSEQSRAPKGVSPNPFIAKAGPKPCRIQCRRTITSMNRSSRIDSEKSLDAASAGSETPAMEKEETGSVHLRRIDPAQNMRRFYTLAIQPTLFGGASVIRNWGRIGTNGQSMMETFDQADEAVSAKARLERSKRQRGYRG